MNKKINVPIPVLIIVCAVALIFGVIFGYRITDSLFGSKVSNLTVSSEEDLTALVDQIYAGVSVEMPMLMTMPVDTTDVDSVKYMTGLENAENIEFAVVSEPMMSSQAYSMVLVKAKDGADVEAMAKSMNENIDERKWICVTAEKIYTTTSGNVICLVMSNPDTAKTVYDSFKTLAGSVGEEYERTAEEPEMPEDMLPGSEISIPEEMPIDDQPAAM